MREVELLERKCRNDRETEEMIFVVQRYLEDRFHQRGLNDPDQYAVRLANLFDKKRLGSSTGAFLSSMGRLRTSFFRSNPSLNRRLFEASLLRDLDRNFKKKKSTGPDVWATK